MVTSMVMVEPVKFDGTQLRYSNTYSTRPQSLFYQSLLFLLFAFAPHNHLCFGESPDNKHNVSRRPIPPIKHCTRTYACFPLRFLLPRHFFPRLQVVTSIDRFCFAKVHVTSTAAYILPTITSGGIMKSTPSTATRVTKRSVRSNRTKKSSSFKYIGRQSLRIAIQESIETARQHSNDTGANGYENDTAPSAPTIPAVVPHKCKAYTTEKMDSDGKNPGQDKPGNDKPNGIPAGRPGWYYIDRIFAEVGKEDNLMYLVEWEGINPATGMKWPNDWTQIKAKHVNATAIKIWENAKVDGKVTGGVMLE
ncbi:hypothetical protein BJ170DRAFT_382845 [Xylariales sp. AK1849]|nr:hypothetical protein BJ170DRAFT_382845 [Xylariales sp. AK1849]